MVERVQIREGYPFAFTVLFEDGIDARYTLATFQVRERADTSLPLIVGCDQDSGISIDYGSAGLDLVVDAGAVRNRAPVYPTDTAMHLYCAGSNGARGASNPTGASVPSGDYCVEAVLYKNSFTVATRQPIFQFSQGGDFAAYIYIDANGRVGAYHVATDISTTPAAMLVGKTTHIVVNKDSTAGKYHFFINGKFISSIAYSGEVTATFSSPVFDVGCDSANQATDQTIGAFAFYYGVNLSDSRIAAHALSSGLLGI